jgi:uncharacterized protein YfaS (alpha-2-macroglobulin family)
MMVAAAGYRGLVVERIVQRGCERDDTGGRWVGSGPALSHVRVGESVCVTVQVTSPDFVHGGVLVVDALPGGLEAVDERLSSSGAGAASPQSSGMMHRMHRAWTTPWWFEAPPSEVVFPDRVEFFASRVDAGTHAFVYRATAVTRGAFAMPPALAFAVSQPELRGTSTGGAFSVVDVEVGKKRVV